MMSFYGSKAFIMMKIDGKLNSMPSNNFEHSHITLSIMFKRSRTVTTTPILPEPICLLCGVEILHTDKLGMPVKFGEDRTPLQNRHWKRLWKLGTKQEHLIISADEVDKADVFPHLWSCLYRAIIKDSATQYHLTGISSTEHCQPPYYAVNNPTKARIRGKRNSWSQYDHRVFTEFYATRITKQPKELKDQTIGFVVHAHCWSLLGQIEGPALSNINLAKFVRVCRQYWRHNEKWSLSAHYTGPYENESNLPYQWEPYHLDVSQSPLVPAIQEAIDSAAKTGYNDLSSRRILPLELMILIAEYVCPIKNYTVDDVHALRNMLLGFRWELPKSFWRVRLDERFIFELWTCNESSLVDWKLRLGLMSLMADREKLNPSGLVNRERVLRIMRALMDTYRK